MSVEPERNLLKIITEAAREVIRSWPDQKPRFAVKTGWADSYDDLFAGTFSVLLEEGEILGAVLTKGRAILSGRGGDGKTWLLRRLFEATLQTDVVPVFIDLKQWSGADYETWRDWTCDDVRNGADFIVRRFSGLGIGTIDLDRLPPECRKIIFVDGLNEITSKVGAEILMVLDEIVSNQIGVSVLVVDRLIRRSLPNSPRWKIGTPLPLSDAEIQRHTGGSVVLNPGDIRRSPFFLDAEIKYGAGSGHRASVLKRLLVVHGKLDDQDIASAATASFEAYRKSRSRTFGRDKFVESAGANVLGKLEQAGLVSSSKDQGCYFTHHIVHDFLAASCVTLMSVKDWTPGIFRALSFDASSFDAVGLAFEQLTDGRADVFLQKLYDWNLYAAGYALAQAGETGVEVGPEMRTVILAMLSDKKFDPVLATRRRATDALQIMQLPDAKPFREAMSVIQICDAVDEVKSETPWFKEWRRIFMSVRDVGVPDELWSEVRSADSITGWTVANVVKRMKGGEEKVEMLADWLRDEVSPTIRWRIAHVLGAFATDGSLKTLLELLDSDSDIDVRYGAIRSVIEVAANAVPGLRLAVSKQLDERAPKIGADEKIASELRSCLLLDPVSAPDGWIDFVRSCVRSQFLATDRTSERDVWRGCLNTAEELYCAVASSRGTNG